MHIYLGFFFSYLGFYIYVMYSNQNIYVNPRNCPIQENNQHVGSENDKYICTNSSNHGLDPTRAASNKINMYIVI